MRILVLAVVLLVSACASNPSAGIGGSQEKNGWPAAEKVLHAEADYVQLRQAPCNRGGFLWCTGQRNNADCHCVFEHDADERAKRLLGVRQPGGDRYSQGNRRSN